MGEVAYMMLTSVGGICCCVCMQEKAAGDERLQGSAELEQAEKTLRAASEMLGQ